ncbi:MAG: hypothetical protein ACPKOI_05785 [Pleomorphochaeta sp.]
MNIKVNKNISFEELEYLVEKAKYSRELEVGITIEAIAKLFKKD